MRAMTEIEWLDGRVTKVPELALGDALGESVQAELDFGFDDVLEGLWVEVRHHEPDEDSDGDPRGWRAQADPDQLGTSLLCRSPG